MEKIDSIPARPSIPAEILSKKLHYRDMRMGDYSESSGVARKPL